MDIEHKRGSPSRLFKNRKHLFTKTAKREHTLKERLPRGI